MYNLSHTYNKLVLYNNVFRIESEYQEIQQSQTADNPMTPQGRAKQQSRDTRKTNKQGNQLPLPNQDNCKTRMGVCSVFC